MILPSLGKGDQDIKHITWFINVLPSEAIGMAKKINNITARNILILKKEQLKYGNNYNSSDNNETMMTNIIIRKVS